MDLLKLKEALEKFNQETLPKLDKLIDEDLAQLVESLSTICDQLSNDLHGLLDRLNGTKVVINIPPRKDN